MIKNMTAFIIISLFLLSCNSEPNITSFKIKNPYLANKKDVKENISVTILHGEAGGEEQNINRWRGQIGLPLNNLESIIKTEYQNPFLGKYFLYDLVNTVNDKAILAAIIPQDNQTIFVKMNTSSRSINDRQYEFNLFCQSLYFDQNQKIVGNSPSNWIQKEPIDFSVLYYEIKDLDED